jgi:muramoyltetrapeptide carboxypeptidase
MNRRSFLASAGVAGFGLRSIRASGQATSTPVIKPRRLKAGDRVAIVNPAGATFLRSDVEIVVESLEALGLEVKKGEHVLDRYGYLAGTDEERAADLNAQFADESVDGVVAVRGGWGCARILPLLDYDTIARNPKIIIGYSDVTALLLGIHARTGLVTYHGPIGLGPWNSYSVDYVKRILFEGEEVLYANPTRLGDNLTQVADRVETIYPGRARGRLLGGNLTVLTAIIGSSYLPDWEGAVLFLEDVHEDIYRIDRMLTQLRLAGILEKASAVVIGKCTDCSPGTGYGSLTLEQVFDDHLLPLKVPAWQGAMIGHIPEKWTLPEGILAEVDADKGTIQLLESPVASTGR